MAAYLLNVPPGTLSQELQLQNLWKQSSNVGWA